MVFVSSGGGAGSSGTVGGAGVVTGITTSNAPAIGAVANNHNNSFLTPASIRLSQDVQSPRVVGGNANSSFTSVSPNSATAAHMLYQQLFGAAAMQSQLLQSMAGASQASPMLPTTLQQHSSMQPQAQHQPNQAFLLANAAQALAAAQGHLALNQFFMQNPLQQQMQAALAQLLNPIGYYQQLASILQQSQLTSTHIPQQQNLAEAQNGLTTPVQQQKLIENLVVEQAVRSSQDAIASCASQSLPVDNKSTGLLSSPESVKEHISRLIIENEAILEQNPGLLKRRPYHRQIGSQSSIELDSGARSCSSSPGIGVRDARTVNARSNQSFYDASNNYCAILSARNSSTANFCVASGGGSLTNGQPIARVSEKSSVCAFCHLVFSNEAALDQHEPRCSKRMELASNSQTSQGIISINSRSSTSNATVASDAASGSNIEVIHRKQSSISTGATQAHEYRHPLKRRLLAAAEHLNEPQASTSKTPKLDLTVGGGAPNCDMLSSPIGIAHSHSGALQSSRNNTSMSTLSSPLPRPSSSILGANMISPSKVAASTHSACIPMSIGNSSSSSGQQQVAISNSSTYRKIHSLYSAQFTSTAGSISEANKPYILTLGDIVASRAEVTTLPRRNRVRNITTETFVTLNRPQPVFCEHRPGLSMYSNWQQNSVDDDDAKLNLLYMSTCSTKPRIGVKQLWRYTTALREMGVLKVTHSSFWDYSTKMRLRQNAVAAVACSQVASLASITTEPNSTCIVESSSSSDQFSNMASTNPVESLKNMEIDDESSQIWKKLKNTPNIIDREQNDTVLLSKLNTIKSAPKSTLHHKISGGYRTDEVYVYVRGRGRGRYVCDRCGIRCKKPSMLKKHIRSHLNIRPYGCKQCNFNFKTKGNLTKHLQSKTHHRRLAEKQQECLNEKNFDSDQDRLEIVSNAESSDFNDPLSDDDMTSDEEVQISCEEKEINFYRKFGQENILLERNTHTPPMLWIVGETISDWPITNRRRSCHSAPPSMHYPPETLDSSKAIEKASLSGSSVADKSHNMEMNVTVLCPISTSSVSSRLQTSNNLASPFLVNQTSVGAFLAKETMICDICKRAFRSSTEMALHRKIHLIGAPSSRIRSYQCTECKFSIRSKIGLQRHMEDKHGISDAIKSEQNDSDNEVDGINHSSQNPRSFMCTDCKIGFRKHGILAKHLRSKTHVMKLESLRCIPEDSLALITRKESVASLNDIDTTDCEHARRSIIDIVASLRDSAVLECREQLSQSPVPIANSSKRSPLAFEKRVAGVKNQSNLLRRNEQKQTDLGLKKTDVSTLYKKNEDQWGNSVSANIWIPPKAELTATISSERRSVDVVHSIADSVASAFSDNGSSVRSDEANSDGAGARSECSTPTQRLFSGTIQSPLPSSATRCNLCEVNYETSFELQVHLHADHIMLRDGKDFRCPKKFCDKVYPSRENLRHHIAAHYRDGISASTSETREEPEGALSLLTDANGDVLNIVAHRKSKSVNSGNGHLANSVPNNSPNAPEESHTAIPKVTSNSASSAVSAQISNSPATSSDAPKKRRSPRNNIESDKVNNGYVAKESSQKETNASSGSVQSPPAGIASLPCAICGQSFPDAFSLQKHWLSHVSDRPHICKLCDAGFTTQTALNNHVLTHRN